jgi:hypothetical protein
LRPACDLASNSVDVIQRLSQFCHTIKSRSPVQKSPRHLGLQRKWAAVSRNVNSTLALQQSVKNSLGCRLCASADTLYHKVGE